MFPFPFFLFLFSCLLQAEDPIPKYFATVCDREHYNWCILHIESIFQHNQNVKEIAVFDINLTPTQKRILNEKERVVVLPIEEVNPHMKEQTLVRSNGRMSRGWYSWKPVAIKQALERYPYVLYIDAGIRVSHPLDRIFQHIIQNGSFFFSAGHNLEIATSKYTQKTLGLDQTFLQKESISSGVQGLTQALYETYALPCYQCSKDIKLFKDDGSSQGGFGWGRHDQTIFSIFVHKNNLKVHNLYETSYLTIDGEKIPFDPHYFFLFKSSRKPKSIK